MWWWARTAHSRQGRACFWRGEANPCRRAPFGRSRPSAGGLAGTRRRDSRWWALSSPGRGGRGEREERVSKGKETVGFVPFGLSQRRIPLLNEPNRPDLGG